MNYAQSRHLFQNGDVVFFSKGKRNLVRTAITWFTRGAHYHVGIAFWMQAEATGEARLMLAESQPGGYRLINLGFYRDRDMTIFRCPVPWSEVGDIVIDSAGELAYSLLDLLHIGMHERFGVKIPRAASNATGYVCSVIVARMLKAAGLTDLDTMVSPEKLKRQLEAKAAPEFFVRSNKA